MLGEEWWPLNVLADALFGKQPKRRSEIIFELKQDGKRINLSADELEVYNENEEYRTAVLKLAGKLDVDIVSGGKVIDKASDD